MDEFDEIDVNALSSKEDLERAKLLAEIRQVRAQTADLENTAAASGASQYNNRVIHFNDVVDYKSCQRAVTQLSEMARLGDEPIEIIFHSPGGDIFSGWGLYDYMQLLRARGIKIITIVLGGAFSMAGILLQGGDVRVMTPHSWLMIHEAGMSSFGGTTSALKDEADLLKRLEMQGNAIFAERSNVPLAEIESRTHRKNWWLSADEALALGFIDEIRPLDPPTPISKARKRRSKAAA